MKKYDVFISYSFEDLKHAQRLSKRLNDEGYSTWFAQEHGRDGSWRRRVELVIQQCSAFIPIISSTSESSTEVEKEIDVAIQLEKRIMPYVIDNLRSLPYSISTNQVIEQFKSPEDADSLACDFVKSVFFDRRKSELLSLENSMSSYFFAGVSAYIPMSYEYVWEGVSGASDGYGPRAVDVLDLVMKDLDLPKATDTSHDLMQIFTRGISDKPIRLVLTGEAGSGKTMTLIKLFTEFSNLALENSSCALPVYIPIEGYDGKSQFVDYILGILDKRKDPIRKHFFELLSENRVALMLDGFGEGSAVVDFRNRSSQVLKFLREYPILPVCVTCLSSEYTAETDLGLDLFQILPLTPIQVKTIIHEVCETPEEAEEVFWALFHEERAEDFLKEFIARGGDASTFWNYSGADSPVEGFYHWNLWIEARDDPFGLFTLSRNTFLLTIIIRVFQSNMKPTTNKFKLFDMFFNLVVGYAERTGGNLTDNIYSVEEQKSAFSKLAVAMIKKQNYFLSKKEVDDTLGVVSDEIVTWGIREKILSRGEGVNFSHQLMRAFFASLALEELFLGDFDIPGFPNKAGWWNKSPWDEAFIFLVGKFGDRPTRVLNWLRDQDPELASRCIMGSGCKTDDTLLSTMATEWITRLAANKEPQVPKASVGRALGRIRKDTRPGVTLLDEFNLPIIEWCPIQEKKINISNSGNEILVSEFQMSKYLVTNSQFEPFIADGGYTDKHRDCWTKVGWDHIKLNNRRSPDNYTEIFRLSNHPRIGTIWYEANAFTNWLTKKSRLLGLIPADEEIRLPTESEWESAARGPEGNWDFPWGNDFNYEYCNVAELRSTSAVGILQKGASFEGVHDLVGNAWSWCLTKWSSDVTLQNNAPEGKEERVYRGGSWTFDNHSISKPDELKAYQRYWIIPEDDQPDAIGLFLVKGKNLTP